MAFNLTAKALFDLKRTAVKLQFTDADLEAYLDESLDSDRATQIEDALANDSDLISRLAMINGRRDAGIHTLGEIWRRNQIGVPTPEVMGNFILGILPDGDSQYIQFRMDQLKCCFTLAMFNDLQLQQSEKSELSQTRRERIYKTSAGLLKRGNSDEE